MSSTEMFLRSIGHRAKRVRVDGQVYFYIYRRGCKTPIGGFLNKLPSVKLLQGYLFSHLSFVNVNAGESLKINK